METKDKTAEWAVTDSEMRGYLALSLFSAAGIEKMVAAGMGHYEAVRARDLYDMEMRGAQTLVRCLSRGNRRGSRGRKFGRRTT